MPRSHSKPIMLIGGKNYCLDGITPPSELAYTIFILQEIYERFNFHLFRQPGESYDDALACIRDRVHLPNTRVKGICQSWASYDPLSKLFFNYSLEVDSNLDILLDIALQHSKKPPHHFKKALSRYISSSSLDVMPSDKQMFIFGNHSYLDGFHECALQLLRSYGVRDSKLFVLLGPSGAGKSTVIKGLNRASLKNISRYTTRAYRSFEEVVGEETVSISPDSFEHLERLGSFLVPHERDGHRYGILRSDFDAALDSDFNHVFTTTQADVAFDLRDQFPSQVKVILLLPHLTGIGLETRIQGVGCPSVCFSSFEKELSARLHYKQIDGIKERLRRTHEDTKKLEGCIPDADFFVFNEFNNSVLNKIYRYLFFDPVMSPYYNLSASLSDLLAKEEREGMQERKV